MHVAQMLSVGGRDYSDQEIRRADDEGDPDQLAGAERS